MRQMDIGVGAFVFSQGVVSAIPILRDPQYLHAPTLPKLRSACMKVAPLILLGVIRVLLVKGTDYPVSKPSTLLQVAQL